MPDGTLVALIAAHPPSSYVAAGYRHMAPKYAAKPLLGEGAGQLGVRWNPPGIATLYLATEPATATAELGRLARRGGREPEEFPSARHGRVRPDLGNVLDLRQPGAREHVGLTDAQLADDNLGACQAVGEAARYAGREAIIAPSAAGTGEVLAIYLDELQSDSTVDVTGQEPWSQLPAA